ncbi:phage integrase SAM-like domain-containing protein [Petrimonas sulfuriphila]|uniref:phage integrase SAM-like domain-containing protein n=1 Tax=Petrimonas sulfuriphila TaxID=285070 RepID=UPI00324652F2
MPSSDNYLSTHPVFKYKNRNISVSLVRKYRYDIEEVAPIFWRITYNRKLKVYFSGFEFSRNEWDEFVNRDLRKHAGTKQTLLRFLSLTLKPAIDTLAETNDFSFAALDNLLTDQPTSTVNEAFQKKIVSLENEYKIGNASIYRTTLNALMRFKHYKLYKKSADKTDFINRCIESKYVAIGKKALSISEKISFEEITPEFLIECEKFWLDTGVAHATIGIYMRTLRAIINNNEGEEPYINQKKYPFGVKRGKYAIPEGGRRNIALPVDDIWKIENYQTDNDAIATARDIFVFMFYCNGLNFGDLCRLRYENIDAPSEEIIFQRKKTLRKGEKPTYIYAPMLPPMVEIINRQGNKNQDGYIFPFLNGIAPSGKNERKIKEAINFALDPINSSLKIIANKLELDPEISTSYTRNSYITHLTSEMYVNPIVVRKMVGHSTKKDVTAGYVNLTPKKRREINSKLLNPKKKYATINSGKSVEVG